MAQFAQAAEVEAEIEQIHNRNLDPETKNKLVRSIRQSSFASQKKASTIQTILSISNSMLGTSTLLFPMLYMQVGIITALIISIIMACISRKTSILLCIHNKAEELDLPETIVRLLGPKWKYLYTVSNIVLLWFSGVIYFILICNQIYPLLCLILDHSNVQHAVQTSITFSEISYQWVGVIFFFLILPLLFQRNLGFILKLISYAVISVFTFILFIIFKGFHNLITNTQQVTQNLVYFTGDLPTIAGVYQLALMIQSLIVPIAKTNQIQKNNKRDITIAFVWTWLIYNIVGIFGALAIAGVTIRSGVSGSIVLDYFNVDWSLIVIQVLFLLQLTLVFPVLQFITRSQFFALIYLTEKPPKWQYYGFTVAYTLACLLLQIIEADLSLIVSLLGQILTN